MKKGLISLLLVLICLPLILSVEIDLSKDSYQGMETLQAEITGNFISLSVENVLIYEEGRIHHEAVLSGLVKKGYRYYYYAVLPDKPGNFSLRIENAKYIQSGKLIDDANSIDFKIIEGNGTILSVNPGFIIVNEDDFFVNVMSYNGNKDVTASFNGESKTVHLIDSLKQEIEFSVLGIQESEVNLNIGDYNILVFILKHQEPIIENITRIKITPVDLIGSLNPEEDYIFELILENNGNKNISKITVSSDLDILIEPISVEFLEIGKKEIIKITILKLGDAKQVSGNIIVNFSEGSSTLPISFVVGKNDEVVVDIDESNIIKNDSGSESNLGCANMGGEVCLDDSKCDEDDEPSLDGPCCLGKCVKESGFNWWYIGLLILILAAGISWVVYTKIKKNQIPKSNKELLNDKTEIFKRRMGFRRGVEVNKGLDRV